MKKTIYLFFLILVHGCQSIENTSMHTSTENIYILADFSDSMSLTSDLNPNYIFSSLSVTTDDRGSGAKVTLSAITNLRLNPEYMAMIPSTDEKDGEYNEVDRINQIVGFKKHVTDNLRSLQRTRSGREHSYIFESISQALHKLKAESGYSTKRLCVISDLIQNTPSINFYNPACIEVYESNPVKFNHYLDSVLLFPKNLKGIKIELLHSPRDESDDTQFFRVSKLFINYLEAKGATVNIKASLIKQGKWDS